MSDRFHWARLLAFVTGLVTQELLLRNEYLAAENRILRAHLPRRLRLTKSAGTLGTHCDFVNEFSAATFTATVEILHGTEHGNGKPVPRRELQASRWRREP
jgi:hypothetical protein